MVSVIVIGVGILVLSVCQIGHDTNRTVIEEKPMSIHKEEILSAQVVLKPASGKSVDDRSQITSKNIKDFVPSTEAVSSATVSFRSAGFQVGQMVGNSFSITAPADTFEKVFHAHLERHKSRGVEVVKGGGSASYELPLDALPKSLSTFIETVTFTPPPEFGPTNFGQ
jgi:subtilase family serine protease